jgi:hypothetical protein
MATVEKRVRNGNTTHRVRYRDPTGHQRSRVFARKADAQRFLNETETAKARGTWTDPALGRVRCASASLPACVASAWTCCAGRSRWPRSWSRFAASFTWGRLRPEPAGARSGCRGSSSRSWPPTWLSGATRRPSCSPPRPADHCGSICSALGCGAGRPGRRAWRGYAFMIFGTRRWRRGSRPVPTPRRSRLGRGTRR